MILPIIIFILLVILLAIIFWYVTLTLIIIGVLWIYREDIKKIFTRRKKEKENPRHTYNSKVNPRIWNIILEFSISDIEAGQIFESDYKNCTTSKLFDKLMQNRNYDERLLSMPKYLILKQNQILEQVYEAYKYEIFTLNINPTNVSREQLQKEYEDAQSTFKNIFENYESYKQNTHNSQDSRQSDSGSKQQNYKKGSRNKTSSDSKQYSDNSRETYHKIHEKRINERLTKFGISESDAEIIFGKIWRKTLGKQEWEFFYDVWSLDIKITFDSYGKFREELGNLYSKLLEIIRIVDEENPEMSSKKDKKNWQSSSHRRSYSDKKNWQSSSFFREFYRRSYSSYERSDDDSDDEFDDDSDDEFDDDSDDVFDDEFDDDSDNDSDDEYNQSFTDFKFPSKISWAWSILELASNSPFSEIKKRYRELSLKYHPDRNKSPFATKKMVEINEAYEVLSKISGV
ncbi:MAG: DnaJ domain-containing protein [Crenarchaeota archaeon]|nr:DnaJ domain-containing protein [Thermoproteota archaeon]